MRAVRRPARGPRPRTRTRPPCRGRRGPRKAPLRAWVDRAVVERSIWVRRQRQPVLHLGQQPAAGHLFVERLLQPGDWGSWFRSVPGEEVLDSTVGVDLDVGALTDPLLDEEPLLFAERRVRVVHHLGEVVCPVAEDRSVRLDTDAVASARQFDHVTELRLDERFLRFAHRSAGSRRDIDVAVGGQRHVLALAQRLAHRPQVVIVADDVLRRGGDVRIQRRLLTTHRSTV